MGLSISNPSATVNSKLLVTKSNTAGAINITGTASSIASITSSAGAFSSWVQYVASTGAEYVLTHVGVYAPTGFNSTDFPLILEIGVGGAGSEAVLLDLPLPNNPAVLTFDTVSIPTPLRVAASSRVALRLYAGGTASVVCKFSVFGVAYANLEGN